MAKEIHKDRILSHMSEAEEKHAKAGHGGGFSGAKSKRTKRRQELLAEQERHAMDKPKKLETQTDGDLSEVKKDPVWKTWLKQKDALDPKARKDEKYGHSDYSEGGRTSSGKLKPSKTTRSGYGFMYGGSPYSYDSTEQVGGGQSHGKQSKQVREEGTEYRGLEEPRQSQSVIGSDQGYNRQNRTELKHPEKFRTSHLPMDRHIMSKKPAKGERKISDLKEGGTGKIEHEKIYSEPDRRYQSDWEGDPSERGTKDTQYSGTGVPKDEMTRTETIIHDKIPKGGEAPKGTWRGRAHRTDEQEEAKKKQQEKREKKRKLQQKLDVLSQNSKQSNKKKAWEVWLDNVTKPIPDSKGGRGSFQHCINANQDKNNPGGWCKQIERKIGKGKDEGESEEVKISTYDKLRRIKDRLQAHNKGLGALGEGKLNRKTGKPMKLKPRKITLDDFEHDDKPSYFKQVASEEKKKKEKKKARPRTTGSGFGKAKNKRPPIKGISSYRQGPKKMENQGNKDQMLGGKKRSGEAWMKFWNEHRGEILQDETDELVEANVSDANKTDKCPGCEGEGKKWHIGFMQPYSTECPGCKGRGRLTPTEQQDKDAKEADDKQYKKLTDKADYFVEEIRSNIIYHNKIFPLIGMVAGQAARGMGKVGKKIGGELLEGASEVGQGMLQGVAEEEEEQ